MDETDGDAFVPEARVEGQGAVPEGRVERLEEPSARGYLGDTLARGGCTAG